jgi:hypothetical protein
MQVTPILSNYRMPSWHSFIVPIVQFADSIKIRPIEYVVGKLTGLFLNSHTKHMNKMTLMFEAVETRLDKDQMESRDKVALLTFFRNTYNPEIIQKMTDFAEKREDFSIEPGKEFLEAVYQFNEIYMELFSKVEENLQRELMKVNSLKKRARIAKMA